VSKSEGVTEISWRQMPRLHPPLQFIPISHILCYSARNMIIFLNSILPHSLT